MNAVMTALAGGALIGLATVLLMLALGRIAGIAGIVGGLVGGGADEIGWRIAFLTGLIAGPFVAALFGAPLPDVGIDASVPVAGRRSAGWLRFAARHRLYQRPRCLRASRRR